jgi:hypothetical protein
MARQLRPVLALALVALIAPAAVALAAKTVKGGTYRGALVHTKEPISLKVSKGGKAVTVSLAIAPLYCEGGGVGTRQETKAAAIAKDGSFKGSIAYEFEPTHRITARLFFSGKFSGRTVKGTARSEFPLVKRCDGSTTFSAKAK